MLRTLRLSGRPTALRRLLAALLWSVLGLTFGAEPLLADVCDGDAPAAAVAALVPHTDGATLAGTAGALPSTASVASVAAAEAPAGPVDGGGPEHAVHVCHCTHAHGSTLADGYAIRASTRPVTTAVCWCADRLPPSPALEPQLRPPVLSHAA